MVKYEYLEEEEKAGQKWVRDIDGHMIQKHGLTDKDLEKINNHYKEKKQ